MADPIALHKNAPCDSTVDGATQTIAGPSTLEAFPSLSLEFLLSPAPNPSWHVVEQHHFDHVLIPDGWYDELKALETRIGITFQSRLVLQSALVHHGHLQTNAPGLNHAPVHRLSNRSLEFLGDSLLGMAVASYVFQCYPQYKEGQLSTTKAAFVNNRTLCKICVDDLQMQELILVSSDLALRQDSTVSAVDTTKCLKGRQNVNAGAVEALIAAIYLDQGVEVALRFINEWIIPSALRYAKHDKVWEPGNRLQSLLQANGLGKPTYRPLEPELSSPGDDKHIVLIVQDQEILCASGPSTKDARKSAARAGFEYYQALLS